MNKTKKTEIIRIIKFALISLSAGGIQLGSFSLLDIITNWSYWPKYLIAISLSVVWNFTINRRYTFKAINNIPIAMLKVIFYYLVFTPLSIWWGIALEPHMNEYIILIGTMLINGITEYIYQRLFVFGSYTDSALRREDN